MRKPLPFRFKEGKKGDLLAALGNLSCEWVPPLERGWESREKTKPATLLCGVVCDNKVKVRPPREQRGFEDERAEGYSLLF